ncbi:MAG TPA: choice-of-anchor D domain-containing protein, partial [Candidatus Eisenbacteria bacterium]
MTRFRRLSPTLLIGAILMVLVVVVACENELLGPADDTSLPACQVRDADLDFGETFVGQVSEDRSFTVRNIGGGVLAGQVVLPPGAFEIISGGGSFSLAPGQLRRVLVRFRPTTVGAAEAELRIGTGCRFVALSGMGMTGDLCRVSRDTLDFGSILVGEGAVERSFTLFNDGQTTLSGMLSAPCGSYTIVSGGGAYQLVPGASRVVTVRFAPTGAGTDNCLVETGLAACADVVLIGEGLNQFCEVTPGSLSFGEVCVGERPERMITLRNPGTAPISGTVGLAIFPFQTTSGAGAYTLQPGQSREITVIYRPDQAGSHTGSLPLGGLCGNVPLDGSASRPFVCQLSTNELRFDNVPTNSSETQSFTIVNSGCGNGLVAVPALCGGVFDLGPERNIAIGPGQSVTLPVIFRPASDAPVECLLDLGTACGPLRLVGSGMTVPVCRLTPEVVDFGPVTVGQNTTRTFTIENAGDGILSGVVPGGCDNFTVTAGSGSFSLGPRQTRSVTVRFQPTGPGIRSCVLSLGTGQCTGVTLNGLGDAAPACEITPSTLLFGGVVVNTNSEKSFVVRNAGGGMLNGTISENCNGFEVISGGGAYSLAGGESRTVTVRFRPTVQGMQTCGIGLGSLPCNNVAATGTGTAAGLCRLQPVDLDFGTVFVGETADRTFTLSNLGGAPISGNIAESCGEFSIVSGGGAFSIGQNQSVTVTVRFAPTGTGTRTCS